jgi:hypothetical protein
VPDAINDKKSRTAHLCFPSKACPCVFACSCPFAALWL